MVQDFSKIRRKSSEVYMRVKKRGKGKGNF